MGPVNLSPGRLAVLVALVVGGVAVMVNGFGDDGSAVASGPSDAVETTPDQTTGPTGASTTTTTPDPPAPEPLIEGVVVQVLNGTNATGLAGQVDQLLEGKGYQMDPEPGDLQNKPISDTTVYFRAGDDTAQSRANAANLARRYLKGVDAVVKSLNTALEGETAVDDAAQIVVVLGEDYAEAHPVT